MRARLQAIASDRNAPALARYTAVEELTTTEWAGRDVWYLSLFADETLMRPTEGSVLFTPLTTLSDSDPDRWIPVMTKLVESKDAAVRHNAAFCLAYHAMYHPRRDAILPVLPWLYDPEWLPIHSSEYTMFVGKLDEADVPESVPALIWFVEHNEHEARWIATTLGHYRDPRAVPVLRRALARETSDYGRQNIFEALADSGGLPEEEQLAGLEAYVAKLDDAEGSGKDVSRYRASDEVSLPLPVSLGHYLALKNEVPDSLARAALARAEALRKKSPTRSRLMLRVIEGWQSKQVELDMVRRIGAGAADADTITKALERRAKLRESVRPELYLLAGGGGTPQGVAAVILEEEALARGVLESDDAGARLALLACARLAQAPLPVAQVGALLRNKNPLLALAAERYLLAEDGAEARALLLARHPGEAFVTGWRENVQLIGGSDFSAMGRAEEKLREELYGKDDAPLEIIALMSNEERPSRVLRVYASRAVYTEYEDDSRYRERAVAPEEVERFKDLLAAGSILDSGPRFGPCHYDCWAAEFFSVRREGGRRVFIHAGVGASLDFTGVFNVFGREGAIVRYNLEDEIEGLEILYSGESLSIEDVWQKGGDLRVLARREATLEEEVRERAEADEDEEEFGEQDGALALARHRRREHEREREKERASWRAFAAGKLGAAVARPEGYSTLDEAALDVDEDEFPSNFNSNLARAAVGDSYVLAGGEDEGIWKKSPGHAAVRVGGDGGVYADPVVTPDGAWAVAAKAAENWAEPSGVVRFDLRTGREYPVSLPPAKQFAPVAYVAAHGKILLRRARDEYGDVKESDGPAAPEFYLLDPATGRTQQVSGVFEPLLQEGKRALQPTGRPDEFWAAVPGRAKNETRVGLYSVRDFSFRALLTVPHIKFDSFEMWADESASKLLVVYRGQLLRLPLRDDRDALRKKIASEPSTERVYGLLYRTTAER